MAANRGWMKNQAQSIRSMSKHNEMMTPLSQKLHDAVANGEMTRDQAEAMQSSKTARPSSMSLERFCNISSEGLTPAFRGEKEIRTIDRNTVVV